MQKVQGTRGRPRGGQARDTRSAILEAALDAFSTDGFDRANMKQIAQLVGVTEPAVYRYFANKREILDALIEMHGSESFAESLKDMNMQAAFADPRQFVKDVVTRIFGMWASPRERKFERILFMCTLLNDERAMSKQKGFVMGFQGNLERAAEMLMNMGVLKKTNPALAVHLFTSALFMLKLESVSFSSEEVDVESLCSQARDIVDYTFDLLAPQQGVPSERPHHVA